MDTDVIVMRVSNATLGYNLQQWVISPTRQHLLIMGWSEQRDGTESCGGIAVLRSCGRQA